MLWGCVPVLLVFAAIGPRSVMDLQWHDTYFVFGAYHVGIVCSFWLILTGFVYRAMQKVKLVTWMKKVHILLTLLSAFIAVGIVLIFKASVQNSFTWYRLLNQAFTSVVLIAVMSQLLFLVNVAMGLARSAATKKDNGG